MGDNIINEKFLTVVEKKRLAELEGVVKENFLGFVRVGSALAEIREKRLYRNQENRTWEGYCRELWDMSARHAERLEKSARVIENLRPIGRKKESDPDFILPMNEAQARPLANLKPEEQIKVWGNLIEHKTAQLKDGEPIRITAITVKKAVLKHIREELGTKVEQIKETTRTNRENFASDEFKAAYDAFGKQLSKEHKANWRHTSRQRVFDNLSSLLGLVACAGPDEIKKKGCAMELSNREKLEKGGFRVFRMRPKELVIEESIGGEWKVITSHDTPTQLSDAFKELLGDPKHLRG